MADTTEGGKTPGPGPGQDAAEKHRRDGSEPMEAKGVVAREVKEGHANFVLMYDMLTGIRIAVSRCEAKIPRDVRTHDFQAAHKVAFDSGGNELTPSSKYDFKFKDYAPWIFRHIRACFHVDPAEYLLSLTGRYVLSELGSPGKSGSFFYYSSDYRFIIKTIHHTEHELLLKILPYYYEHVRNNPYTLVSRIFGLHRVKLPHNRKIHFVVMGNVFPQNKDVHEVYDLKGSTLGREYPEEKAKANPRAVMKDLNWIKRDKKLLLGPKKSKVFLEQLERDVAFLIKYNIMDYSLLVGIHDLRKGNKENIRDNTLALFETGPDNKPRAAGQGEGDGQLNANQSTGRLNSTAGGDHGDHAAWASESGKSIDDKRRTSRGSRTRKSMSQLAHQIKRSPTVSPARQINTSSNSKVINNSKSAPATPTRGNTNIELLPSPPLQIEKQPTTGKKVTVSSNDTNTVADGTAHNEESTPQDTKKTNSNGNINKRIVEEKEEEENLPNPTKVSTASKKTSSVHSKASSKSSSSSYGSSSSSKSLGETDKKKTPNGKPSTTLTPESPPATTTTAEAATETPDVATAVHSSTVTGMLKDGVVDRKQPQQQQQKPRRSTPLILDTSTNKMMANGVNIKAGDRKYASVGPLGGPNANSRGSPSTTTGAGVMGGHLRSPSSPTTPGALGQPSSSAWLNSDAPSERAYCVFYKDDGGFRSTDWNDRATLELYYIGVIDIFTKYNWIKRGENVWKSLSHDKKEISSIKPKLYGQRFLKFVKASICTDAGSATSSAIFNAEKEQVTERVTRQRLLSGNTPLTKHMPRMNKSTARH